MDNQINANDWLLLINFMIWGIIGGLMALMTFSSIREKEKRAAVISGFGMIGWSLCMVIAFFWAPVSLITLISVLIILMFALFFLPLGKTEMIKAGVISSRVNEQTVIFSREEYETGTEQYKSFYNQHPELKEIDDSLRALPELFEPGGKYYDKTRSDALEDAFVEIEQLAGKVDGAVNPESLILSSLKATGLVKEFLLEDGAFEVGIAKLNPMWVYSNVGRGPEKWGEPIVNNHKYVICFALEMKYEAVQGAPGLAITEETVIKYRDASRLATGLAEKIRELGYPARAHVAGSNYQIMLPPAAADAGLGELSRMGYLISPKHGGRVRLGAVTTDFPLQVDKPICFGVQEFCERCLKCAVNCPSQAIPSGPKTDVRGVMKWPLNIEQCLRYWRTIGTDCGLCMKVCPFSHPPTITHEIIKQGIKRSVVARKLSIIGDNILYGKRPPTTPY